MAPQATIAADTPQIDTADASMTANSSSTFNFLLSHMANIQTTATTTNACNMPGKPALTISVNKILVPNITNPVLIKNSDRAASFNQDGSVPTLLNNNPMIKAKTTYSTP